MDVCDLEGPWGPHHHHHIASFACEKDGLDHKRKGSKDFVPMPDKTHAAQQLHALLPTRPDVAFLRTDQPFLLRFLRARKFRVGDAFLLLCRYFEYRQRHRELFRGLNVGGGGEGGGANGGGTTGIQAALLDGLPGVLAERDPCGRPVIVLLASNWDHSRYDVRVVYQAVLLTLERLVEEESVQANGVVAILDWSNFPARLTTSLSPKLLRLMLDGLQDAFPLRLGAIHLVNQPWYVEAALGLARPFLKEKLRSRIHVHGNNLATLHAQVPPRLLPAELGGEGAEYHPHTWASTMFKRTPSQQEQQESSQQEQQQEQLPRDQPPEEQHQGQADTRVARQESNSHNGFNGPTKKAQESPRSFSNHNLSLSTSCDLSSENTSAAPPSPDTPLVNKPETNSTIAASFTAMIFGKSESVSKSNGNMSDGEEVALKAH
ncbi:clavesin-2-like [Penaeus japonicus]|uniref:clavesin-2-like n=1 Tax=Penaeus japonicus TaxID=27405 RepID=UPI001C710330|nr:clavesin-2-like [Penaeus japonicus]XP_042876707.1 clavesin-2-like [Penaeus japonicus]